jgi:hypothetical protein
MIPVSMRRPGESGPGNRIALVYIQLPVDLAEPQARIDFVKAETKRLKSSNRAENMQAFYSAGRFIPTPLRGTVTRALASTSAFNLTVSQAPGPRGAMHVLGCEVDAVYPAIPISDGHAVAIGMFRYREQLFVGTYADPDALPEITQFPALLADEMRALANLGAPIRMRDGRVRPAPAIDRQSDAATV